ncbi:VOC family protein [Pendulispora albinea]|uniref:VOC family protein n=1 Tax=Pendulispora albinea TaxID=2741071 RepID=A0ABZ2M3G6_9BACT
MIQRLGIASVYVLDQERAKRFYTEILGFEVRTDAHVGSFRWITVVPKGQPDLQIALMAIKPGTHWEPETAETVRALVEKGTFGFGAFHTADCRKTYEELKARGVEFMGEPEERPYGVETVFKDDSGNWFALVQPR